MKHKYNLKNSARKKVNTLDKNNALNYISNNHLDFGCGYGIIVNMLAKRFPKKCFDAVDLDIKRIKTANKEYKLQNINFKNTSKINKKYSSISCMFVLHHEKINLKHQLNVFYKQLNKNGSIIIYDFRKRSRKKFKEWFNQRNYLNSFEEEYIEHNQWTIKKFKKICKSVGFKTIQAKSSGEFSFIYIGKK